MELLRTFRLDLRHLALIEIILFVTVSNVKQRCALAATNNRPNTGDADYRYEYKDYEEGKHSYQYGQVQTYDYGQQAPQEAPDTSILCYVCEYEFIAKDNHVEGVPNCKDPFNHLDVPEMKCKGPCSKKYTKMDGDSFRLVRNCLPNCKDRSDETSYTQCCNKKLCNGYSTSYSLKDHRWVLLLSCLCALILAQL